jgi:hypothetical protein
MALTKSNKMCTEITQKVYFWTFNFFDMFYKEAEALYYETQAGFHETCKNTDLM